MTTIPCVGAVAFDGDGRLLLVRRANPPAQGRWSLPGGRVEPGERGEDAVVREVLEETGLVATVVREVGTVERDAPGGGTYVIRDFLVEIAGPRGSDGTDGHVPIPGDDASDARWASAADLERLPLSPGLVEALASWGLLPR